MIVERFSGPGMAQQQRCWGEKKALTGAHASSSISLNYLGVRVRLHNQNIKQLNGIHATFISTLSTSVFSQDGKMSSVDRTKHLKTE